jgi:1-aminocyclopropane-1-carboxylate deaminase
MLQMSSAPVQEVKHEMLSAFKVRLFVKREDLIHPSISGNKWRKLKYNLIEAKEKEFHTFLTFGGAYSNHIYASAAAGKEAGFNTIGIIRGEEHHPLNPTLQFAVLQGMKLSYIDRESYRLKNEPYILEQLEQEFGRFYLIPEGGSNSLAVKGCAEIIDDLSEDYDFYCAACGTGGTLAGLILGLNGRAHVLGFPVLKGAEFLFGDIRSLVDSEDLTNWSLFMNYHFGGYAKVKFDLINFINSFYNISGIPLDPIYTGKMVYGVYDLIKSGYFPTGSKILCIHTGGLQGNLGMR